MAYQVSFNPHAARAFRKLSKGIQVRLKPAIDGLRENPRPSGVEKLSGLADTYRIRVGDYRILYEVRDAILVVLVIEVAHRREVYR